MRVKDCEYFWGESLIALKRGKIVVDWRERRQHWRESVPFYGWSKRVLKASDDAVRKFQVTKVNLTERNYNKIRKFILLSKYAHQKRIYVGLIMNCVISLWRRSKIETKRYDNSKIKMLIITNSCIILTRSEKGEQIGWANRSTLPIGTSAQSFFWLPALVISRVSRWEDLIFGFSWNLCLQVKTPFL
jgi:hypothetical protein